MRGNASRPRLRLFASTALLGALAAGCASRAVVSQPVGPPKETGRFRGQDLVEIASLDPTIHLDIRYATPNNFTGRAVYDEARAFLQRPAAEALVRVNHALREKGYGLLVFDGYQPWRVTKRFWDITSPEKREKGFVANPAKGSKDATDEGACRDEGDHPHHASAAGAEERIDLGVGGLSLQEGFCLFGGWWRVELVDAERG